MQLPYPVVLASASPRRRELLARLVPEFEVLVSDVDETPLANEEPAALAERLAESKARAVAKLRPESIVIGGDTVVALADGEWKTLGKPQDAEEAKAMLRLLSGRQHFVFTGLSVVSPRGVATTCDGTQVEFRPLEDAEIERYVATGEPMDKAGAYAIQGGAAPFVLQTVGHVSTVIGLPVEVLERLLESTFTPSSSE